jgi:puromycin-sensitive aminopeptidase
MVERERVCLPHNVRPVHYDLRLVPDLRQCTFSGQLLVDVQVTQVTSQIVVNALELKVSKVWCGDNVAVSVNLDENAQTLTAEWKAPFQPGDYTIGFEFEGILNDRMVGFYASKYQRDGVDKVMAVTQFEATDARRALPCWDEPALKAQFTVTLVVDSSLQAVSNMPIVNQKVCEDGKIEYQYDKTPIMSIYLLAFVIGEFDYIEAHTKDNVAIRVYTPPGKTEQGQFGLDVSVKVLEYYNEYFEIAYPLPKLDLLAIPDFAAGAMENWGCITYRSTALLVDPSNSSATTKQWVALVIAHELAHQWFGNLVTMEWWTHLWLNEGFASWVEYLAVDHLFPDWKIWTQFVYEDFSRALKLDALVSSHAVEVEVFHANEIDEIFDHISYAKGCSIIRMLVNYLGEEPFRQGMVLYLKRWQYKNASTEDLWAALEESTGRPVANVMQKWTQEVGFPVLNVSEHPSDPNTLILRQNRFIMDGTAVEESRFWHVPLNILYPSADIDASVLTEHEGTVTLGNNPAWIKFNAGQAGVYRVCYSASLLSKLRKGLEQQSLQDPVDRLGLENDCFALARAGLLPTPQVLSLLQAYRQETNYTVWADLIHNNLSDLYHMLMLTPLKPSFRQFGVNLLSLIADKVGWEAKDDEDHLASLLRSLVIPQLGSYGHRPTIQEACRRFARFVATGFKSGLSPDLRGGVYALAVAHGGVLAYEAILELYEIAELHEEKVRCLRVLGKTPDPLLLERTMDFAFSDAVRGQDVFLVVSGVATNPAGTQLVWDYLQKNWNTIVSRFGGTFLISRLVQCTAYFASESKADEVEQFFTKNKAPGAERAVSQSVEKIRSNAAWLKRDQVAIEQWFQTNL